MLARRSRASCKLASAPSTHPNNEENPSMLIGVPAETAAGEKRVATVPDVVEKLVKLGFSVAVQSGAGDAANFADDTYRAAGAEIVGDVWSSADIVFKVRAPSMA